MQYSLGRVVCPGVESDIQNIVTKLNLLSKLQFSTRPSPGSDNQVLLSLSSYNYELNPLYKSITSTNSFISETSAFLYVVAQYRSIPWIDQLSLDVNASSLNTKRLKVILKSDKGMDIKDEISFVKELR